MPNNIIWSWPASKSAIKIAMVILITILLPLFFGCADKQEELLWKQAQSSDSIEMYKKFLSQYPESKYVNSANKRMDALLYPLKEIGFPDLELISTDIGMTCWDDSATTIAYRASKETLISWDDLERHFNWESQGARMWHAKKEKATLAGIQINQSGQAVSFGSLCIGTKEKTILTSGPTTKKSNGILFGKGSIIAHKKP